MGSRSPHEAKRNAGLVSPHGTNPDYAKSGLDLRCWDNVRNQSGDRNESFGIFKFSPGLQ